MRDTIRPKVLTTEIGPKGNAKIIELGDVIWHWNCTDQRPYFCVFLDVHDFGWIWVKEFRGIVDPYDPDRTQFMIDQSTNFYATKNECIEAQIERLESMKNPCQSEIDKLEAKKDVARLPNNVEADMQGIPQKEYSD